MQHGRSQLRDWMKRREFTQREAAAYLGIDETFLTKLLSGVRQPGLTNAVKLERHTGIPIEAWMSSEQGETDVVAHAKTRKRA